MINFFDKMLQDRWTRALTLFQSDAEKDEKDDGDESDDDMKPPPAKKSKKDDEKKDEKKGVWLLCLYDKKYAVFVRRDNLKSVYVPRTIFEA